MARMQLRLQTDLRESLRRHLAEHGEPNASEWIRRAISAQMARERLEMRRRVQVAALDRELAEGLRRS